MNSINARPLLAGIALCLCLSLQQQGPANAYSHARACLAPALSSSGHIASGQERVISDPRKIAANIAALETVISNVGAEFENADILFRLSGDSELAEENASLKTALLSTLEKIMALTRQGCFDFIGTKVRLSPDEPESASATAPFIVLSLTGNPPTWGHVNLALEGMLRSRSSKVVMYSRSASLKDYVLPREQRYAMLGKIEKLLSPLFVFNPGLDEFDLGDAPGQTKGASAGKMLVLNPAAPFVRYLAGGDHARAVLGMMDEYNSRHEIPNGRIEVIFASRAGFPARAIRAELDKQDNRGFGLDVFESRLAEISSTAFRNGHNASIPLSIRAMWDSFIGRQEETETTTALSA